MRNGSKSTSDIDFESALLDAIGGPGYRDGTKVVHVDQSARVLAAPGERHLKLASEVLGIRMS